MGGVGGGVGRGRAVALGLGLGRGKGGREGSTAAGGGGEPRAHLLVLLDDLVVLVGARVVLLGAPDVEEDGRERLGRVRVPPQHQVGPADVVEDRDVAERSPA